MSRPSYKELWLYEHKDRDEQLQWIRDAVDGNAKFCSSEPPYSEEEELARKIMQMHARIAELEESDKHWAGNVKVCMQLIERYESDIAELEAALTNARELIGMTPPPAFPGWIPVKEKLPNLFKTVIIARAIVGGRGGRFDLAFNSGLVWVGTQQDIEYEDVTHWMPLPEKPEVQE